MARGRIQESVDHAIGLAISASFEALDTWSVGAHCKVDGL